MGRGGEPPLCGPPRQTQLSNLSEDVMLLILKEAEFKTILLSSSVNKALREVACDKRWYKRVDAKEFGGEAFDDDRARFLFNSSGDGNRRWASSEKFVAHKTPLTKLGLRHVWESMEKTLQVVDLTESRGVDDSTLRDIATKCSQLKELSLGGCCLVTSRGMSHLAERSLRLESLALNQCLQITDVSPILRGCQELRALNLRACGNIGDDSFLKGIGGDGHPRIRALGLPTCFDHLTLMLTVSLSLIKPKPKPKPKPGPDL